MNETLLESLPFTDIEEGVEDGESEDDKSEDDESEDDESEDDKYSRRFSKILPLKPN